MSYSAVKRGSINFLFHMHSSAKFTKMAPIKLLVFGLKADFLLKVTATAVVGESSLFLKSFWKRIFI